MLGKNTSLYRTFYYPLFTHAVIPLVRTLVLFYHFLVFCLVPSLVTAQSSLDVDSLETAYAAGQSGAEAHRSLTTLVKVYGFRSLDVAADYQKQLEALPYTRRDPARLFYALEARHEISARRGRRDAISGILDTQQMILAPYPELLGERAMLLQSRANQLEYAGDPSASDSLNQLAISLARRSGNPYAHGLVSIQHAGNFGTDQIDSIFHYLNRALELLEPLEEYGSLALIYRARGYYLEQIGEEAGALADYTLASEYYNLMGMDAGEALVNRFLGMLHYRRGRYELARDLFTSSYAAFDRVGSEGGKRGVRKHLAKTYLELGRDEEAVTMLEELHTYQLTAGRPHFLLEATTVLARAYLKTGRLDHAEERLLAAVKLIEEGSGKDTEEELTTYTLLGELALQRGQTRKAIDHFRYAEEVAREFGQWTVIEDVNHRLSDLHQSRGQYRNAFLAGQRAAAAADTLRARSEAAETAKYRTLTGLKSAEYEITDLTRRNEIAALQISNQRLYLGLFLLGVLLSAGLAITFYTLYRRINRKNRKIERQNERIEGMLAEKDLMMQETHHRALNNLGMVQSLLELRARSEADSGAGKTLTETGQRIHSIRLIHEHLYRAEGTTHLAGKRYLKELIDHLRTALRPAGVRIKTDLDEFSLRVDDAVPLGLIVNEALTNAFKYAFPDGRGGTVAVDLRQDAEVYRLRIADDGVGMEREGSVLVVPQLIRGLAAQLKASLDVSGEDGTVLELEIPRSRY